MSLRTQVQDKVATYPDPIRGVNLRESEADLKPGEARLMQNCIYRGGVRTRPGGQRVTASSLGAFEIRGGHKYYFGGGTPQSKRLIAYSNKISVIADNGTETNLTTGMTSDKDTQFCTWSITDKVYICNSNDTVRTYDGTTFATLGGTNPPTARWIAPILDRLMAITTNGIERTSPRVDNAWSSNSSWATLRPSLTGLFTCIFPHTLTSVNGDLFPGLLAFQSNAYYLVTGTNFGADATAVSASAGEDSSIKLIDPRVGTSSPYSVCSVPGVGIFWLTSDRYVYFVPYGRAHGYFVGDKIFSTGTTTGTEGVNMAAVNQAWMVYYDRFLRLGFPTGSDVFPSVEYWLDMRQFMLDPTTPVWYGPMTGRTLSRVWTEIQNGDQGLFAGEGNSANGAFVYQIDIANKFTDPVATADNNISFVYQTYFADFGAPSRRKYVRNVELDLNTYTGTATMDVVDIYGTVTSSLPINAITR